METDLDKEFNDYWTERIPGLREYARAVLNSDNDFLNTLHYFLLDMVPCKVLDVGTGIGIAAIEMSRLGFEVTAIDHNKELLDAAKEVAEEFGVNVDFLKMDLYDLDLKEKTFDIVIMRNCIWNLTDPEKAMADLRMLLRPGGYMMIFDGNYYLYHHDPGYMHRSEAIMQKRRSLDSLCASTNVNNVDLTRCDELSKDLPLSKIFRPTWDIDMLSRLGFTDIDIRFMDDEVFLADSENGQVHTPVHFAIRARLPLRSIMFDSNLEEAMKEDMIEEAIENISGVWNILSNKDCVRALLYLYQGGMTIAQVADAVGCSYSLASYDLKRLMATGLIDTERIDGEKVYFLKDRRVVSDLYILTKGFCQGSLKTVKL